MVILVGYDAGAADATPSVDLGRTDRAFAGGVKAPTLSRPGGRASAVQQAIRRHVIGRVSAASAAIATKSSAR